MTDPTNQVRQHYARDSIVDKALDALQDQGKDPDRLTVEDLAPLDQMHLRGIEATREVAKQTGISKGEHVLDIGSGLGGAARTFAADTGCQVVGVDLTPEFVQAATAFTRKLGLEDRVEFREGDAGRLPFDDDSFDVVTSMAVFMNIPDKKTVYQEIRRVLRPGGRLAQLEVMAGKNPDRLTFPVLWATEPSFSFLETPEQIRGHLENNGFQQRVWIDTTQTDIEWAQQMQQAMEQQGAPRVGPHTIHGTEIAERMKNSVRALVQGAATSAIIIMDAP